MFSWKGKCLNLFDRQSVSIGLDFNYRHIWEQNGYLIELVFFSSQADEESYCRYEKYQFSYVEQFIAILMEDEIHVYRYNTRKIKTQPVYVSKIKTVEEPEFLLFLKDTIFGVFYKTHLIVNQIEETNYIRQIFNKSYGVA